jgi:Restriction endonuclease fold toxin 5
MSRIGLIDDALDAIGRLFRGHPDFVIPKPGRVVPRVDPTPPPQPRQPPPRVPPRLPPQREQETETAPDTKPEPQTEQETSTTTEEMQECETCPDCEPRKQGRPSTNSFGAVGPAAKRGYDYQHFVCPWHAYSPATNQIEEWKFSGADFDGLHPAACHLFETKHGYDGFLREDDWSPNGRPTLQPWFKKSGSTAFEDIQYQAERQAKAVKPHYPKARLTWVFSSMVTKLFVYEEFLKQRRVPPIEAEVRPFDQGIP